MMQKLPTFDSAKHEFTYFAVLTMKNAMAVEAIENRLNIVAERINELVDKDSSVDLEGFKAAFLDELAALLDEGTQTGNLVSTPELDNRLGVLELQYQILAEKVSKIEMALGHEKGSESEKPNIFDLLV